jgi:hypothetical protein
LINSDSGEAEIGVSKKRGKNRRMLEGWGRVARWHIFKPKILIWRTLPRKMLVFLIAFWSILQPFGLFCDDLVYFMDIWYQFTRFGILYQEKSGNLGLWQTNYLSCRGAVSIGFALRANARKC